MSLIGNPLEQRVIEAWEASMKDVLHVKSEEDIPELNIYQCGTYKMHSLDEAKAVAQMVLSKGIGVMDNDALKLDVSKL